MKKFCFDTSGFTNPQHIVPIDRFPTLWNQIADIVVAGDIAMTADNYDDELVGTIRNPFGDILDKHRADLVLEIGVGSWDFGKYIGELKSITNRHHQFIAGRGARANANTVSLNDVAAIALARATGLPLVSMEKSSTTSTSNKRIPDICVMESVDHLDFIEFLRKASIVI